MQHTEASHRLQQALTERLLTAPPVANTTVNQRWPLIMLMEEVMMVMKKGAGEPKKMIEITKMIKKKKRKDPTCCDRS